jgi:hypothetical protein
MPAENAGTNFLARDTYARKAADHALCSVTSTGGPLLMV